ncbi:MAG: hypothetical protein RLZZ450_3820 [Pseudomonadota bacterium]|jgi:hypothetical protein
MHDALERAYALGDHHSASALAAGIVAGNVADESSPACVERARAILEQTRPDPFLSIIGALGLGLTAWLVYNYVL